MSVFFIFWAAYVVSLLTLLSVSFSLGLWIYNTTGSMAEFAIIGITTLLPAVLLTPVVGLLVDRFKPRRSIIASSAIITIAWIPVFLIFYWDAYSITLLTIPLLVIGAFAYSQTPAYNALVVQLIAEKDLDKANAFFDLGSSLAILLAPLLGGTLISYFTISHIVLLPIGALTIQMIVLIVMGFCYQDPVSPATARTHYSSDFLQVCRFVYAEKALLALLIFGLFLNAVAELAGILVTPLGLTFFDEFTVGLLVTLGGIGAALGHLLLSVFGGFKDKLQAILTINFIQGIVLIIIVQFPPEFAILATGMGVFFFFEAFYDNADLTYWQQHSPEKMRATLLSFKETAALAAGLLAYGVAAPLTDGVFKPLIETLNGLRDKPGWDVWLAWIPENAIMALIMALGVANILFCTAALMLLTTNRWRQANKPQVA